MPPGSTLALTWCGPRASGMECNLSEPLPFDRHRFDWIVSSLTLHYLPDWTAPFQEFFRVLNPGGHLLFSVHHPFMDFTTFHRPNYFTTERLTDVWTTPEAGQVTLTFYRRPLHDIINTTVEHFALRRLREPQPVPEFLKTASISN